MLLSDCTAAPLCNHARDDLCHRQNFVERDKFIRRVRHPLCWLLGSSAQIEEVKLFIL
jgi:hypothetical protein